LFVVNLQAGQPPLRFQSDPVRPLHALERAGHRIRIAAEEFQFSALMEIGFRFIRPAEPGIRQAAEVVGSRITAAAGNGRIEQAMCLAVIAGKVGVHPAAVKLFQRVLRPGVCGREGKQGN